MVGESLIIAFSLKVVKPFQHIVPSSVVGDGRTDFLVQGGRSLKIGEEGVLSADEGAVFAVEPPDDSFAFLDDQTKTEVADSLGELSIVELVIGHLKLLDGEACFFASAEDARVAESGEADEIFQEVPEASDAGLELHGPSCNNRRSERMGSLLQKVHKILFVRLMVPVVEERIKEFNGPLVEVLADQPVVLVLRVLDLLDAGANEHSVDQTRGRSGVD